MNCPVNLDQYDNGWYHPGRGLMHRLAWFFFGLPLLRSAIVPSSRVRVALLRLFGAKVGTGVVIKPGVRVKYPWLLSIGDHTWIGEDCWIDNLVLVEIGANVCISQGAYLCTGNHDWSDPAFGLRVEPIHVQDGGWIGAKAIVTPGVVVGTCAVAAAGSVVRGEIPPFEIHGGNPAVFLRRRTFTSQVTDAAKAVTTSL